MAIKNLIITPPIIGRISIGETVEHNGKKLPKKSDEFHITSNVQSNGKWVTPPVAEAKAAQQAKEADANSKLRTIPVRIMFDTPENNFRANYACFNNEGRQICSGNGEKASRRAANGSEEVECTGHDFCAFGKQNRCKPYGRLIVALESQFEKDPLAGFAFRTTGYNSVNALTFRMQQFAALSGGSIAGMPCNLVLRAKSTSASKRQAIFYTDIEPRGTLKDAVAAARKYHAECQEAGIDLAALDKSVAASFEGNAYVESDEDAEFVASELYVELPANEGGYDNVVVEEQPAQTVKSNVHELMKEIPQGGVAEMLNDTKPVDSEPSKALLDVLSKLSTIDDPKRIPAARVWIKNNLELSNEFERQQAFDALDAIEARVNATVQEAA